MTVVSHYPIKVDLFEDMSDSFSCYLQTITLNFRDIQVDQCLLHINHRKGTKSIEYFRYIQHI